MKAIEAAEFREQCLSLSDQLDPDGLVITKRGTPVARLMPYGAPEQDQIGSLRDKIEVKGNVLSSGLSWDADARS